MADLIWAPNLVPESDSHQLDLYLRFAGTCCVRSGGCNIEQALEMLHACKGNITLATKTLLTSRLEYTQSLWNIDEVHEFERLIMSYGKNFFKISNDLKSKSVKECVQFYYSWKKSSFRRNTSPVSSSSLSLLATPSASTSSSSTSDDSRDSGRLSSISDDQSTLSAHTPLPHYVKLEQSQQQQQQQYTPTVSLNKQLHKQHQQQQQQQQQPDKFPCKVCGRIFEKIKSRSAHMKRHKNER